MPRPSQFDTVASAAEATTHIGAVPRVVTLATGTATPHGLQLFQFTSFEQWVARATQYFQFAGVEASDVVCLDTQGRTCRCGADFARARDDDSFPVAAYLRTEAVR